MAEAASGAPSDHQWAAELRDALRPRTLGERRVLARLNRLANVIVCSQRLWHTTNEERFAGILRIGAILPEPPLPDAERWGSAEGPPGYPLVRSLGGVSVFDFRNFAGWAAYERNYPSSSLRSFVPVRDGWDASLWIEIDCDRVGASLLFPEALGGLRETCPSARSRKWMPVVEAAHLGPLPVTAFRRCFRINRSDGSLRRIPHR